MFMPVTDADVPHIVALMNRAYRGADGATGWATEHAYIAGDRTTAALLRADMASAPAGSLLKWVTSVADTALGCVWLAPEGDGTWYLGSLAADPQRQRAGLGKTLLAAAEDWIRAQGGTRVRMTVINLRETLIDWYLRRGYRLTGAVEPFPYDDGRFGTPLRDDLAFVVLEKPLT